MAIVQNSRIQIRRLLKELAGVPQLSSGELAWALDSQELYIGNGSVAEGAPEVGNTKILTENDNILDLASLYEYKRNRASIQTGSTINDPIIRSLQDRLDELVSVKAFGAMGDNTDQTIAINRAITSLYINSDYEVNEQGYVTLLFEPGIYRLSGSIAIPPNVTIKGAGIDKTIFIQTANVETFITVNSSGQYDLNSLDNSNQPNNIVLSDFTVRSTNASFNKSIIKLLSLKNSVLENIKLVGPTTDITTLNNIGLEFVSSSNLISNNLVYLKNIQIFDVRYGVYSDYDISNIIMDNLNINNTKKGIAFGINANILYPGQSVGPHDILIFNSTFDNVYEQGVITETGYNVSVITNKFLNVGNNGLNYITASYPILDFGSYGNLSENNYFERENYLLTNTSTTSVPCTPSVVGNVNYTNKHITQKLTIGQSVSYVPLLKFPYQTSLIKINYHYKTDRFYRSGTMEIVVDVDNETIDSIDNYSYVGNDLYAKELIFKSSIYDVNSDTTNDTVILEYINTLVPLQNETNVITFTTEVSSFANN